MTMGIYVPSRGRAGMLSSRINTAKFIKQATYVVPTDEVRRYQNALSYFGDGFEVLGCEVDGIDAVRRWIGATALTRNENKFLMLDDDLNFCVRKSAESFHLRPAEKGDVAAMLEWTDRMLDDYAHVSVSPRQANNVMEKGDSRTCLKYNKRTIRYLAYQTSPFLQMKHGRVPVMEDFDVNLQLLRSGRKNVVSYWWAQDQRETGSQGGCSSYRTLETHDAAARKLAELHHPFVKLRTKKNKGASTKFAMGFVERTEVTIYWEKAYQSSQKGAENVRD